MHSELTDEQNLLISTVSRFIANVLHPLEDRVEADGALSRADAEHVFEKSKKLGLYALNIPVEYGGGGLSSFDWILAEEQFGHASDILVRRAFGNVYDILLAGTASQKQRWLVPAASGAKTFSIAFTEPGAGSDAAGIATRAEKTDGGWVLNGQKQFVSDALHADAFIVTAVTDPASGSRGISTFVIEKGTKGFSLGPNEEMMGLRGTTHASLYFEDVEVGAEYLLGSEGKGLKLALDALGRVRLAQVAARSVGKATRLLNFAVDHARERHQFGRAIGEYQMIKTMLADSAVEIASARSLVWDAARRIDRGSHARTQISMAKLHGSEVLGRVADRAVQIFGGSGYSKRAPIERLYRDARIFRIFDGTSEIHRNIIAKRMLARELGIFGLD